MVYADVGEQGSVELAIALYAYAFQIDFDFSATPTSRWASRGCSAHPTAAVLRAIRDDLRRAGVPVLFDVSPIDVERLRDAGLVDPPALQESFERLRVAVGATRAEWLDLHAVLTSASFRDRRNHLMFAACDDVGRHLARRARDVLATRPAQEMRDRARCARGDGPSSRTLACRDGS